MRLFFLKIIAYSWLFFRKDRVVTALSIFFTFLSIVVGALIASDRSQDQDYFAFNDLKPEVAGLAIAPSPVPQPIAPSSDSTIVLGPEQPALTTTKLADIRPVVSPSPKISPVPSPTENNTDNSSQGSSDNNSNDSKDNSVSDSTPEPSSTPEPTVQPTSTPAPTVTPSSSPTEAPAASSNPTPSNPPDSLVQSVLEPILP